VQVHAGIHDAGMSLMPKRGLLGGKGVFLGCNVAGNGLPMPLSVLLVTSGRLGEHVQRAIVLRERDRTGKSCLRHGMRKVFRVRIVRIRDIGSWYHPAVIDGHLIISLSLRNRMQ
jgi:hypothetical protein